MAPGLVLERDTHDVSHVNQANQEVIDGGDVQGMSLERAKGVERMNQVRLVLHYSHFTLGVS